MIVANEVYVRDDKRFRILWTDVRNDLVVWIVIEDKKGMPELMSFEAMSSLVGDGVVTKSDRDPYSGLLLESSLSEAVKKKWDSNWQTIESLTRSKPDIFFRGPRSRLLREKSDETGVTLATLYKFLRRYWQRGMSKNALLPEYRYCGARGKSRKAGRVKRGRPSLDRELVRGMNIDDKALDNIRTSLRRYYLDGDERRHWNGKETTLAFAYDQMLRLYYSDLNHETGKPVLRPEYPTLASFRYHASRLLDLKSKKQGRLGPTNYERDHRPILGTSNMQVLGPGSRYQIDATIGDVYLVSRLRKEQIVGRPTIYLVTDVFSRMIVGMYVGLENPSWTGAMSAIANAASDKVGYCEQYGIEIGPDDWPCTYLPSVILGDRAELLSRNSNRLVTELGLTVENSAPYRADWKGIVENMFSTLQAQFEPYVDGYVHQDFRSRTGRDYRLDAKWNIEQFTECMIRLVLHHNSAHRIRGYDFEQDMVQDNVPPVPLDIWNWGIRNRSGALRARDEKEVKVALMPQGRGRVTRRGIVFKNCYYSLDLAMKEDWYVEAKDKTRHVTLSYDPRDMTQVYYRPENGGFHVARMTDMSRDYFGMSLKEILQVRYLDNVRDHPDRRDNRQRRLDLDAALRKLQAQAEETASEPFGSKRSRTGNIRQNKAQEARDQRGRDAFDLSDEPREHAGRVLDIQTGKEPAEDFRYPQRKKQYEPGLQDGE